MKYSEETKTAICLLSHTNGSRKLAKLFNIPRATIRYWISPQHRESVLKFSKQNRPKYKVRYQERNRLYAKSYRETHKLSDEQRQKNNFRSMVWRDNHPKALTEWRKSNSGKFKGYKAKYRATKKGNGGSFTSLEWECLKRNYGYLCICCLRPEPEITLVPDHINPISNGGTSDISNIQPLCKSCNSWKSNKTWQLWKRNE